MRPFALSLTGPRRLISGVVLLVALQAFSAGFFVFDAIEDIWADGSSPLQAISLFQGVETAAALAMLVAIVLEVRLVVWLLRRQAGMERDLRLAGSAVQAVVDEHFAQWGLTGAEADVALFMVKGLSIAEIAAMRGSTEATVKSHLNAIYRKSGTTGRPDLLALILDSLMARAPRDAGEGALRN
ncbi:helix-turn-helix transcriptional regulator [Pararhodobacter aggregans]|uniref:Helix-turn-helix transcriptional regulator n=2 Tax=Pararhodobacter aggregans TaxID=404875 RepID=A0A2T7UVW2_9RHOB|nr:DNA-binding CsgD family transcriptional regulator [Pararhodobacter aggregans]PVE48721.1 helix-turn-helix transcriptional regulator [Pararhodobacter aggregans]